MLSKGYTKTTKKNVSYMPLPTNVNESEWADDKSRSNNDIESGGYKLFDAEIRNNQDIDEGNTNNTRHKKDTSIRHEKKSRNVHLLSMGHRRAESLGNVGQTRRNWSSTSTLVPMQQYDGSDNNLQGKYHSIHEDGIQF